LGDEELGWMDDGMDDEMDGWKGRPCEVPQFHYIIFVSKKHYVLNNCMS
jgi:hypothetical protein